MYQDPFRRRVVPDRFFTMDDPWDARYQERFSDRNPAPNAMTLGRGVRDVSFLNQLRGIRRLHVETKLKNIAPILCHGELEYLSFLFGGSSQPICVSDLPNLWFLDFHNLKGAAEGVSGHQGIEMLQGFVEKGEPSVGWVATLPRLEDVIFHGHGRGQTIDPTPFVEVPRLKRLTLASLFIRDMNWLERMNPVGLQLLQLSFGTGETVDLASIARLVNLQKFTIEGRNLTYVNSDALLAAPKLSWVEIPHLNNASVEEEFRERMSHPQEGLL